MTLNQHYSITEIQEYVEHIRCLRRGNGSRSNAQECLLHLLEEIGELTREVRRDGQREHVANELADCLFYLAALATELKVNLGEALVHKENFNRIRFGA